MLEGRASASCFQAIHSIPHVWIICVNPSLLGAPTAWIPVNRLCILQLRHLTTLADAAGVP